ncbi:AbgT family transporter [Candidatus Kapabacteria bacterium]|nr:AbgT family transporter [Candidatus Kapabacteria bacterium]
MIKKKFNDIINNYLNLVEKVANKLPDPFFLFLILSFLVIGLSAVLSYYNLSVLHPASGLKVYPENLLEIQNLQKLITNIVANFIGFPPLGLVLASMIGIGIADKSGFFSTALRYSLLKFPDKLLVPAVCFVSVNSSLIADAGVVVLPPLAGILFLAKGKNPIAGICASFSAVVGGFSANLSVTALDPLLAELTQSAANELNLDYVVHAPSNYYFMFVSVFLVTFVCTYVTNRIVIPRLGISNVKSEKFKEISPIEIKAIWASFASVFIILLTVLVNSFGDTAFFRDQNGGFTILYESIIPLIIIIFGVSGTVFGLIIGKIKSSKSLVDMMVATMNQMGVYLLLAFAAGQFLALFSWSNLGVIVAVKGADLIISLGLEGFPILFLFLIFSMVLNIFISSASAKWTIIAPVFVPMLMLIGWSPELTQLIYRVADSTTNMITPLLPYFPLIIVFAKKYDNDISLGKLLSSLIPYSLFLFITWSILIFIWIYFNLPLGPDSQLFYQ